MGQKYGPKLFDQTMEFNGGANNAYTTENVTVYTNGFRPQLQKLYLILRAIGFQV
jgi:predicted Zn-dependent peptidase